MKVAENTGRYRVSVWFVPAGRKLGQIEAEDVAVIHQAKLTN